MPELPRHSCTWMGGLPRCGYGDCPHYGRADQSPAGPSQCKVTGYPLASRVREVPPSGMRKAPQLCVPAVRGQAEENMHMRRLLSDACVKLGGQPYSTLDMDMQIVRRWLRTSS